MPAIEGSCMVKVRWWRPYVKWSQNGGRSVSAGHVDGDGRVAHVVPLVHDLAENRKKTHNWIFHSWSVRWPIWFARGRHDSQHEQIDGQTKRINEYRLGEAAFRHFLVDSFIIDCSATRSIFSDFSLIGVRIESEISPRRTSPWLCSDRRESINMILFIWGSFSVVCWRSFHRVSEWAKINIMATRFQRLKNFSCPVSTVRVFIFSSLEKKETDKALFVSLRPRFRFSTEQKNVDEERDGKKMNHLST